MKRRCAMPAWRMCWPLPACTWRWWAAACSGWCAPCWRRFPRMALHYPIKKWAAARRLAAGGFLSGDQRRGAVGGAGLCHAGDDAAGDPAGPPGAVHAQSWRWRRRSCCCCGPKRLPSRAFRCRSRRWRRWWRWRNGRCGAQRTRPRGVLYRYAHGIVLTSLVGSLATLPFALFHFEPRHALRRAGQSDRHAGDGLLGDAGGGAVGGGDAVRAGSARRCICWGRASP